MPQGSSVMTGEGAEHPAIRHVFIVAREQPDLHAFLHREFSSEPDVKVILDRRMGERRRGPAVVADNHRSVQRRQRADIDIVLARCGFAINHVEDGAI